MTAPHILMTLPLELIQEVISALHRLPRDPAVKDTLINAMQTCRAMRLICSGFITKLVVAGFGALERFPRHAVVRSLDLCLYSAHETQLWLMSTHAAARERLKHVVVFEVEVDVLQVRQDKRS
jgi:hypothetical protein